MYPNLICLFGPDGVGKSTQTEILYYTLFKKNGKDKTVWIRGPHTFSFILSKVLLRSGRFRLYRNPYGRVKKAIRIEGKTLKNLWAFIEFISVLPIILVKVTTPLKLGFTIIADRYVLDSIVSIAYNVEDTTFIFGRLARILLRQIPRRSILIHLDCKYETLCHRRGRLVEPYQYIRFQKECYRLLSDQITSHYIDTSNKTIEQTSTCIIDIIMKTIRHGMIHEKA